MKKSKNTYKRESSEILKRVARAISKKELTSSWDVITNTLWFAIGVEKLMKSFLIEINPLYILEKPEFKNSVLAEYGTNIKDKSECAKVLNEDVISFQPSVFRMTVFSETVLKHKNTLMKLKNARDIIVHHNFSKLDIKQLRLLLNRDFYPFLSELGEEFNVNYEMLYFNNTKSQLAEISSGLQEDINKQIKIKLEGKRAYWKVNDSNPNFNKTKIELRTVAKLNDNHVYPANCPSCFNIGLVFTSPIMEYDAAVNNLVETGLNTKAFKCEFCKFETSDYKELDALKISPQIERKQEVIRDLSVDALDGK